jgi:hypothetical protein
VRTAAKAFVGWVGLRKNWRPANREAERVALLGHRARMASVPPEKRSEQARRAVQARWARRTQAASIGGDRCL